jgi:hypothetical protein
VLVHIPPARTGIPGHACPKLEIQAGIIQAGIRSGGEIQGNATKQGKLVSHPSGQGARSESVHSESSCDEGCQSGRSHKTRCTQTCCVEAGQGPGRSAEGDAHAE